MFLSSLFGRSRKKEYSFAQGCEIMRRRVRSLRISASAGDTPHVGILLTPWLNSAVAFVNLEIACVLREAGYRITLIEHAIDLPMLTHAQFADERESLNRLIQSCRENFETLSIGEDSEAMAGDDEDFSALAFENAVWHFKGESLALSEPSQFHGVETLLKEGYVRVRPALESLRLDWILIPGGVFGLSGIYTLACRKLGLGFFTYDCGAGEIKLCRDDIAAQNGDLPGVFDYLTHLPAAEQRKCEAIAWEWMERRESGRDDLALQPQKTKPLPIENFALLCLNYRADTAALLRADLFPTVMQWVEAVARWACRTGRVVVVRQHPCERLPKFRSTDDLGAVIRKVDPTGNNVRFIAAADPINTYDLVRASACVLSFTSRVGIEAAMLGKPVILGSKVFYRGLGFTYDATTQDEYFAFVEDAIEGRIDVTEEQKRLAGLAYFAVSEQTRIKTVFTAIPADFMEWSAISREKLWSRAELREFRTALMERKYFAVARHEARGFAISDLAGTAK